MPYKRLQANFALRGWLGLPYGILDANTGKTAFLDAVTFQAVSFCNGKLDLDLPIVLPIHREKIEKLGIAGIVEDCPDGSSIQEWQEYRLSQGRYAASVHWSITGRCNLRCRHCYMSAPQAKYGELTTDECLRIVDQIGQAGIGSVSLTGGEPLVRPDFWQLVRAIRQKRIVISQIYTNGVLISDEWLTELKRADVQCSFSLSFDGVGCHDWLRGVTGTEKKVVKAIQAIRRHGFGVGIETALYNKNLLQMPETFSLLTSLGVESWKLSPAMNVGNWQQEQGVYDIPIDELYEGYLSLARRHQREGAPLTLMLSGFYFGKKNSQDFSSPFDKFDGTENSLGQISCRSCRVNPYIMADGKLLPCIPLTGSTIEEEMPDLLETSIEQALQDSAFFQRVNTKIGDILKHNAECAGCEHRLRCGGGCRASAMIFSGDYYGKDPYGCYFFRQGFGQKLQEALAREKQLADEK